MAAGMAAAGLRPVFAVYSTFLQRGYDQLLHDVCLQNLPVVFGIDRAGLVGADGETHQGVYDIAYINTLPDGIKLFSPSSQEELKAMLKKALQQDCPCAVRYNRGLLPSRTLNLTYDVDEWEIILPVKRVTVAATGRLVQKLINIKEKFFNGTDYTIGLVNVRQICPLSEELIKLFDDAECVITVEDGNLDSGFGAQLARRLSEREKPPRVINLGVPNIPITAASVAQQDEFCGLTEDKFTETIEKYLKQSYFIIRKSKLRTGRNIKLARKRVDSAMIEQGMAESLEKARALIMEGIVLVDGIRVMKAGDTVSEGQVISIKENPVPFVSRGGLKLQKAADKYNIDLKNLVCIDIGSSTGGFTDCMLQHGAKKVYAVDVGYGQLDWKLRSDERVVCMERHNARLMVPEWFDEKPDFASIDVSFISLKLILPALHLCLKENGKAVALVKPQFEAERGQVGKNGVVRDAAVHLEVLKNAVRTAYENGFSVHGLEFSPIKGPKGNIEFLMYLLHDGNKDNENRGEEEMLEKAQNVVTSAHEELA